ncbi:MAG: AmmeMemoRadiSam system protein B, partial [Candidatus Eisenbacteria sp.]|nr:AmmeMemoRadiSam system protein B [Candidatus Eisenbacteria bacterium]
MKAERQESTGEVRRPVVAGSFYPGDAQLLADDVDGFLDAADLPALEGEIVGLVSPHAGYVYSGAVAGRAYACVRGMSFDTVVVVAPSHRFSFRSASIFGGGGYATPLGVVPVDRELADAISESSRGFGFEPRAHASEHSLEV